MRQGLRFIARVVLLLPLAACGTSGAQELGDCAACEGTGVKTETHASGPGLLLDTTDFPPRWRCGTWSDVHGWVHISADLATWIAYMAIPTLLLFLLRRRRDFPYPWVMGLFGAFIVCCGLTHLLEAVMFWWPAYRLMGAVKVVTALVSVATAIVMVFVLPKFLVMRSPAQLEQEVQRRTIELESARRAAQVAAETKARFTANVSHELRTPLTAVLGYAELLDSDLNLAPSQRDLVNTIRRNGEHLLGVINDVLDYSRSEAGQLSIQPEATDICALVAESLELLSANAATKGVALTMQEDAERQPLMVDPKRLRQILLNLVGNAIKFAEHGSVRVTVATTDGEEPDMRCVTIDVQDSGVGMTEAQAARVFDEYTQVDGSSTRRFGGSGLGLTISRRLATAMNGSLTVLHSQLHVGTTMRLQLLARLAPKTDVEVRVAATDEVASPRLDGLKVLVVDDSRDNRVLFRATLERVGAAVACAEDGEQGLKRFVDAENERQPFDVVLMDLQMPILDGLAATRLLRAKGSQVPILALTANAEPEDCARSRAAGCSGHLTKPIRRSQLVKAVAQATGVAAAASTPAIARQTASPESAYW